MIASLFIILLSGCSTYYATASKTKLPEITQEQIHVKVQTTQKDWSIVAKLPDETVDIYTKIIVDRNPLFFRDENATNILHVDIIHSNDNGVLEMLGAVITGISYSVIPNEATSNVLIKISLNGVETEYRGELGVAQGMARSALIDKSKYTVGDSQFILNGLIINALDEFTIAYLNKE